MLRIPADTPARLSPMTLWIDYSYWMTALLWLPCIIDIQILNSHLLTVQLVSLLGEVSRFFSRGVLLFIVAKETLDSKYVCPLKNVLILLILLMIGEITDLWNNHWYQWRPFLSPLSNQPKREKCYLWVGSLLISNSEGDFPKAVGVAHLHQQKPVQYFLQSLSRRISA